MAKKQTRRSVSIRGDTYARIRDYCEQHNVSMSEFVEEQIASFFGVTVEKVVAKPVAAAPAAPKATSVPTTERQAAPAASGTSGRGKDKLSYDEMHKAARVFTF